MDPGPGVGGSSASGVAGDGPAVDPAVASAVDFLVEEAQKSAAKALQAHPTMCNPFGAQIIFGGMLLIPGSCILFTVFKMVKYW